MPQLTLNWVILSRRQFKYVLQICFLNFSLGFFKGSNGMPGGTRQGPIQTLGIDDVNDKDFKSLVP